MNYISDFESSLISYKVFFYFESLAKGIKFPTFDLTFDQKITLLKLKLPSLENSESNSISEKLN